VLLRYPCCFAQAGTPGLALLPDSHFKPLCQPRCLCHAETLCSFLSEKLPGTSASSSPNIPFPLGALSFGRSSKSILVQEQVTQLFCDKELDYFSWLGPGLMLLSLVLRSISSMTNLFAQDVVLPSAMSRSALSSLPKGSGRME